MPTVQGKYRTHQMEWGMRIYKELLQQELEKTLVHCMKNKIKQGSNAIIESSKQRAIAADLSGYRTLREPLQSFVVNLTNK